MTHLKYEGRLADRGLRLLTPVMVSINAADMYEGRLADRGLRPDFIEFTEERNYEYEGRLADRGLRPFIGFSYSVYIFQYEGRLADRGLRLKEG